MQAGDRAIFRSLSENVGQFDLRDKTFLIPEMSRIGCHLLAATFRGFGVRAHVMETCKGLDLGKEFTSGKECYPCQVTLGDILYFMQEEKRRLGERFDPENYIYFMPEATGPCRFGMYNKYQRIVLDAFPSLQKLKIGSLTTGNAYSLEGMLEKDRAEDFRRVAFFSVIVGDVLDRLLWRIRPYERQAGLADEFIERAMRAMEAGFETYGPAKRFERILDLLAEVVREGQAVIDAAVPPKPLIGIVGEIYLRTHTGSNQNLVRMLEHYGGEVVVSSMAEWIDYTAYDNARTAKRKLWWNLRQFRARAVKVHLQDLVRFKLKLAYQERRQRQVYRRVNRILDLDGGHRVSDLEKVLLKNRLYSFDVGTEACLSIAGLLEYAGEGYNGTVNVYPFTCMPGTITASVIKPVLNRLQVPYLDVAFDGTFQPGRESTIRTFMYQARQHFLKYGRRRSKGSQPGNGAFES
jgi:predicted nucleotide-binding protein (sugar kinase/HSP70/actin superfamily)